MFQTHPDYEFIISFIKIIINRMRPKHIFNKFSYYFIKLILNRWFLN